MLSNPFFTFLYWCPFSLKRPTGILAEDMKGHAWQSNIILGHHFSSPFEIEMKCCIVNWYDFGNLFIAVDY